MEPDDLLCSRNARSRTPLVGRAQWKINQPPSLRNDKRVRREHLYRSTRAFEDRPGYPTNGVTEQGQVLQFNIAESVHARPWGESDGKFH